MVFLKPSQLDECLFSEDFSALDRETFKMIKFKTGAVYYGQILDDPEKGVKIRHGFGVQIHTGPDGLLSFKYEGYWNLGKKQGKAFVVNQDRSYFRGEYKNDQRNGTGTYVFASGAVYEGKWRDGKMEGQGSFSHPDGSNYVGYFRNNMYLAKRGIFIDPFIQPKDNKEFIEKRDQALNKAAKANTPSEKCLYFEFFKSLNEFETGLEFCKTKSRIPLILSSTQ